MIRDMMLYHAQQFAEPQTRVRQARNLLDFMARSVAGGNHPYSLLLQSEVEILRSSRDSYLFHEHLEECNDPIYFHQFVERAAGHGLRYLAEVDLHVMTPGNYPPEVASVLQMLSPDLVHMEQYMDFLRNRMFRQTLLCGPQSVPNYSLRPAQLRPFAVGSAAKPVNAAPDLLGNTQEEYSGPTDVSLRSVDPVAKAAMAVLAEAWPQSLPFDRLLGDACEHAGVALDTAEQQADATERLGRCLLACYTSAAAGNLVELHVHPPRFAATPGDRPLASPLARYQAERGTHVVNARHELVTLTEFGRQIVRHLDGDRDRPALLAVLKYLVSDGGLIVTDQGQPVTESERLHELLVQALDAELKALALHTMLRA